MIFHVKLPLFVASTSTQLFDPIQIFGLNLGGGDLVPAIESMRPEAILLLGIEESVATRNLVSCSVYTVRSNSLVRFRKIELIMLV